MDEDYDEIETIIEGFDYELVNGEPPDDCMCVLCRLLARDARQTECCGRILCESCLDRYKKSSLTFKCPNCRQYFEGKHFKDTRTDRAICQLQVYCTNKDNGCSWEGEVMHIETHIQKCPNQEITCDKCKNKLQQHQLAHHLKNECLKRDYPCPYCNVIGVYDNMSGRHLEVCPNLLLACSNTGCPFRVKRCEMKHHHTTCPKKIVHCSYYHRGCQIVMKREEADRHMKVCCKRDYFCPHCKSDGIYDFLTSPGHYQICPNLPLSCPNRGCSQKVKRCDLESHQLLCPKKIVKCPYYEIGCRKQIKREDIEEHEENNTQVHLQQAVKRIIKLEQKSDSILIKFNEFSKFITLNDNWLSSGFYTSIGGYKLCLNVYANGRGDGEGTHVSCFVILMPGEYDDTLEWPFQGEVTVELLNQLEDKNHQKGLILFNEQTKDECKNRKLEENSQGWGKLQFIPHTDLGLNSSTNTQYLMNDTLYFRVSVNVHSKTKPWLAGAM